MLSNKWRSKVYTGKRRYIRRLGITSLTALFYGFSSHAIQAETTESNIGLSALESNTAAGWEVSSQNNLQNNASLHTIQEFVDMTGTKLPVESDTPLTEAEMEAIANTDFSATALSETDNLYPLRPAPRQYDYFTWDECRSKGPNVSIVKNHFASCLVKPFTYSLYEVDRNTGLRTLKGKISLRVTVLGRGVRGSQKMHFDLQIDNRVNIFGIVPGTSPVGIRLNCLASTNGVCQSSDIAGRIDTIDNWLTGNNRTYSVQFDTSLSPGGGDLVHFDIDKVSYHELQLVVSDTMGRSFTTKRPFRCDAAPYADGGACIFHDVTAVLHYRLNSTYKSVAQHIQLALDHPELTHPGFGTGFDIPGKEGKPPLTRLYANINYVDPRLPNASVNGYRYMKRTRNRVRTACRRLRRTLPPTELRGKQCDEFPFASTYEGAYFTKLNPGSIYKYSVQFVDKDENRNAGHVLRNWYRTDHIIARDNFFVQIDAE